MVTTNTGQHRLDVIIFGATGFTGAATVSEAVKLLDGMRWGIAGRNETKLRDVLSAVSKRVDRDLSDSVSVVVADVADEESLLRMAEKTKVIYLCRALKVSKHITSPVISYSSTVADRIDSTVSPSSVPALKPAHIIWTLAVNRSSLNAYSYSTTKRLARPVVM